MDPIQSQQPPVDDALAQSVKDALRVQPPSTESLARMRAAVQAEWRLATCASRSRTGWRWTAAAAALAIVVAAAALLLRPTVPSPPMGIVVRTEAQGLESRSGLFARRTVGVGDTLRGGATLTAHGGTLVKLQNGGTLRVGRGTVVAVLAPNEVRLDDGRVYLDFPPDAQPGSAFFVMTKAGQVQHLGTQFEVATVNDAVRVRVREGKVRLQSGATSFDAGTGTELLATGDGKVARGTAAIHGQDWEWADALAPEFGVEGRKLTELLSWAARETGRKVEMTDAHASQIAAQTTLHGSIAGLPPLEAVSVMLATTSLRFELRDDAIRVSTGE